MSDLASIDHRLTQIDNHIQRLSEALVKVAELSAHMSEHRESLVRFGGRVEKRFDDHESRLRTVEMTRSRSLVVERAVWVLFASVVAWAVKML